MNESNPTPTDAASDDAIAGELTAQPASDQPASDQQEQARAVELETERYVCQPPIDIFETEEGLVLQADLPGVSNEQLDLQVQDNKLMLFGRVTADLPKDARLLHQEFHVADFLRSFILSEGVDHDRISAKLNNGVLEVVLPKIEQSEPRRIQVRTE